jgi:hypothetical protein
VSDREHEEFEVELRQIKPARLPDSFAAHLRDLEPPRGAGTPEVSPPPARRPNFLYILRWLMPAAAVVLITFAIWHDEPALTRPPSTVRSSPQPIAGNVPVVFKPDNVQIGQALLASFDAVATLPGGEPVRFRCRQWMDQVVLRDKSQGLLVENRTPRVEVVPLRFETY